jgi:hypothetical protein
MIRAVFLVLVFWLWANCAWAALGVSSVAHADANAATASTTVPTVNAGDVVVVFCQIAGTGTTPTITASGLTFTNEASTGSTIFAFYAIAGAGASSLSVTCAVSGAYYISLAVISISGANTSSPWDSGGPVYGTTSLSLSLTNANPNAILLGYWATTGFAGNGLGSGFTAITLNAEYQVGEYEIVSSSAANNVNITAPAGAIYGMALAVDAAGTAASPATRALLGVGR